MLFTNKYKGRSSFITPWLFACILTIWAVPETSASPLFLESAVHSALIERDDYYKKAMVSDLMFPYIIHDSKRLLALRVKVAIVSSLYSKTGVTPPSGPWYYVLAGLVSSQNAPDSIQMNFEKALKSVGANPGHVCALAMEFRRCGQLQWEQQCINYLEKLLLSQEAAVSIVAAQSLLNTAVTYETKGQLSNVSAYYRFARKFDRHLVWPSVRAILSALPLRPSMALNECENLWTILSHSWAIQLPFALAGFVWFRISLGLLIIAILFVLGIKYASRSLHWMQELFPASISQKSRSYFSVILTLSFISLGIVPFLWLLAAIIWKHCTKLDKWITGICCLLMVFYPISIRFEDMLRQCLLPNGSVSLFKQALYEGYYSDLDQAARAAIRERPNDFLANTAAAIVAIKGNDLSSAQTFIRKAHEITGDDPVVLLTEGIVFFLSGRLDKARQAYERCQHLFPNYVAAFFNCGQCFLASSETIKGMEFIDRATKINAETVNAFISANDDMFAKKWPRLRQFMFPDYTIGYFWEKIFPLYGGSWKTSDMLWGAAFFGLPLWGYCIVAPLIFIILLLTSLFSDSHRPFPNMFLCKLCGAPMCRRCKKGVICPNCFHQLQQIRNENIRQRIIEKILLKKRRAQLIGSHALDIVFPGTGMMYRSNKFHVPGLLCMIFAASSYAACLVLHSASSTYTFHTSLSVLWPLYLIPLLFNSVFIVRAVIRIHKEFVS